MSPKPTLTTAQVLCERPLQHTLKVCYQFACVVRNVSLRGAKVEFDDSTLLPDRVDFEIARSGLSCSARLVWRDAKAAGLVFSNGRETAQGTGEIIPLDLARKLRATERANQRLQSRLDQFLTEF